MQILLSPEEYAALVPKEKFDKLQVANDELRKKFLEAKNFICIHEFSSSHTYCTQCPLYPTELNSLSIEMLGYLCPFNKQLPK